MWRDLRFRINRNPGIVVKSKFIYRFNTCELVVKVVWRAPFTDYTFVLRSTEVTAVSKPTGNMFKMRRRKAIVK